ncbi:MAG: carboxyltransferase domain-containing protein [Planctomycetota bacterium]|nr:MAG: carboxyltransferase domain-containing protein [Planctomycetota bacterium]
MGAGAQSGISVIEVQPYGASAVLVRSALPRGLAAARRMAVLAEYLQSVPGVEETVAGWTEVACYLADQCSPQDEQLLRALTLSAQAALAAPLPAVAGRSHRIPVAYNGADLASVAQALGLSMAAVIAAHQAQACTVGVIGFRPYFAYCLGLDPVLHLPRKAQPAMVQAGAVAIADDMTAIYPSHGPGGWHVLGHTSADRCCQLQVGDVLRFVQVETV